MSISIRTNTSGIIAQSSLTNSTNKLNQTIERMSTGAKLNHASDNAANYSISTNLTTRINAYQVAEDNVNMGLDMVQTASSTLSKMSDLTSHLRALATQAQNGTYGTQSLNALSKEANSIVEELNRLQSTAEYNGIKLFTENSSSTITQSAVSPISTFLNDISVCANDVAVLSDESPNFVQPVTHRNTDKMIALSSVSGSTSLTSGTYSISTKEELVKFSTMCTDGKVGANTEFVLANDIDLSGVSWSPAESFSGTFDGNGYSISNLSCKVDHAFSGFISQLSGTVKNLNFQNLTSIADNGYAGGISVFLLDGSVIDNCLVSGNINGAAAGGIACATQDATVNIKNTSFSGKVTGENLASGIISDLQNSNLKISGCSAIGQIKTTRGYVSGLVSAIEQNGELSISNSYSACDLVSTSADTKFGAILADGSDAKKVTASNCYYDNTKKGQTTGMNGVTDNTKGVTTAELIKLIQSGVLPSSDLAQAKSNVVDKFLTLQVGVGAAGSSQIELSFEGIDLSALNGIDLSDDSVFETLDDILSKINKQQTNLGAIENRLMSALDEISTQYENLVSTRSTLKDADMGELSSEYIKMQILQNASATLLSTANQTPALALQLL